MSQLWETLLQECKFIYDKHQDLEEVLLFLKHNNHNAIETIKIIRSLKTINLGEAKEIFHSSKAWSDANQQYDQFHNALYKAAIQLEKQDLFVSMQTSTEIIGGTNKGYFDFFYFFEHSFLVKAQDNGWLVALCRPGQLQTEKHLTTLAEVVEYVVEMYKEFGFIETSN